MPIDLQTENLLSLTDAARALPAIDGRRPHVSTLWRWAKKGVRGVRLEHVRLGHRICTSREALNRFAQRLAEVDDQQSSTDRPRALVAKSRTEHQRQRDLRRAEADCAAAGI